MEYKYCNWCQAPATFVDYLQAPDGTVVKHWFCADCWYHE